MKNIVIAFFSVLLFFGCKKDSIDNIKIGTIKVDIDGSAFTFSVQAKATRLSVTGGFGIQVDGDLKSTSTTGLSFSIVQPSSISAGSYSENGAGNPVNITITEITSSYVKGTFKGELQIGAGGTETLKNGLFYVSF